MDLELVPIISIRRHSISMCRLKGGGPRESPLYGGVDWFGTGSK